MTELPFVPYARPSRPFSGLVILGEAPGAEEVRQGRPFTGRSGNLLSASLEAAGIDRESCLVANVFRFRPPKNKAKHFFQSGRACMLDGNSGAQAFGKCSLGYCRAEYLPELHHLAETLNYARAVLALGALPLWFATGRLGVAEHAGKTLDCRFAPIPVFPVYHPAFILRGNRGLIPLWEAAMTRAHRFVELTGKPTAEVEA